MQADFLDAHERHWNDAEYLLQAQRWASADHLYGMAAECGLKRLMLMFGMPSTQSRIALVTRKIACMRTASGRVLKAIAAGMHTALDMYCPSTIPLTIGTFPIGMPINPILIKRAHKITKLAQ